VVEALLVQKVILVTAAMWDPWGLTRAWGPRGLGAQGPADLVSQAGVLDDPRGTDDPNPKVIWMFALVVAALLEKRWRPSEQLCGTQGLPRG
jgi:hypothetical protein